MQVAGWGSVVCADGCAVPQVRQLVSVCFIYPYLLIEFQPKHLYTAMTSYSSFFHLEDLVYYQPRATCKQFES